MQRFAYKIKYSLSPFSTQYMIDIKTWNMFAFIIDIYLCVLRYRIQIVFEFLHLINKSITATVNECVIHKTRLAVNYREK